MPHAAPRGPPPPFRPHGRAPRPRGAGLRAPQRLRGRLLRHPGFRHWVRAGHSAATVDAVERGAGHSRPDLPKAGRSRDVEEHGGRRGLRAAARPAVGVERPADARIPSRSAGPLAGRPAHDRGRRRLHVRRLHGPEGRLALGTGPALDRRCDGDRKSTRLNSSHGYISYAVFCLKKKKNFIASMTQKLTLSDISDESNTSLVKVGITTA